ncbi:MAG TPA: DUF1127 domain-containing protein [Burkholderiaceae bacterium]|nr:DUF1127 domain-containing protein [Burkholderiaceae bacterium]
MHPTSKLLDPKSTPHFIPEGTARTPAVPTARTRAQIDAWAKHADASNGFGDSGVVVTPTVFEPVAAPAQQSTWQSVRRSVAGFIERWIAYRRMRAQHAALARLDAATLRDLGISHSEIGSCVAEFNGSSQVTRRRIFPRNREIFESSRLRIKNVDPFL